jgi:hypothetical protein
MNDMTGLESPYGQILARLPGIVAHEWAPAPRNPRGIRFDGKLMVRTATGSHQLLVQRQRSHLSRGMTAHVIAKLKDHPQPVLILAPHVGSGLAPALAAAGINYLDLQGNCHIAVSRLFVHIEGKVAPKVAPAQKGIRSPGYQVLFAFLAQPSLLDEPIREVAEWAGVSRQPVVDMKARLLDERYVLASTKATHWNPKRWQDALALWLHGYETTVRPALALGTYRTRDANPGALETRIARSFASGPDYRWGGSAAGFRISHHYRGERTVIHLQEVPGDLHQRLQALVDPTGNLAVLRAPGRIQWATGTDCVHPLLAYSEMLTEDNERAREAARILYDSHLSRLEKSFR